MAEDGPPQWNGDFLSGEASSNDAGTASNDARDAGPNQRPLQLPRVGWDDDDDDEHGGGPSSNGSHPNNNNDLGGLSIPSINHDDSDGVVLRALSRNSEGELAPIPEDLSMHGAWPDYYPDILGCYDYDERKKYSRYRRCDPRYTRRILAIVVIIFAAIIGSQVSSELSRKQNPKISQPSNDNDIADKPTGAAANVENTDSNNNKSNDKYPDVKNNNDHPSDVDVYQLIIDTLDPMMFDDTSDWDGSFFRAFEFCGKTLSRVPCPYIAYCPLGPGKAPLGGTRNDLNGSWAPIFNRKQRNHPEIEQTDWVQLGNTDVCELYSRKYGHAPPWSHVARGEESTENITRHVMCCLESVNGTYEGQDGGMTSNPDYIHRPPSLEEDEVEKPIPIREKEGKGGHNGKGGLKGKNVQNSGERR